MYTRIARKQCFGRDIQWLCDGRQGVDIAIIIFYKNYKYS